MGSVSAPGGRSGSGKKAVNVELNLVPFIDLLTCLICFLLMSAVWVQIGRISASQSGGAPSETQPDAQQINLTVAVTPSGFIITGNGQPVPGGDILKKESVYDYERLGTKLKELKIEFPEKSDIIVMSEDNIKYEDLINTMDVCLANDFKSISVSGTI